MTMFPKTLKLNKHTTLHLNCSQENTAYYDCLNGSWGAEVEKWMERYFIMQVFDDGRYMSEHRLVGEELI